MSEDATDDAEVERMGWIAELLRRVEFVDWDRFTVNEFEVVR